LSPHKVAGMARISPEAALAAVPRLRQAA